MTKTRTFEPVEIQTADGVSWRRGGNGTRALRLRSVRADRHFVEVSIEEIAHPGEAGGRYVSKQTFFCAEGQHAEAIVDAVAPGYADLLAALKADAVHVHTAFECGEDRAACPVEAFKRAAILKATGGSK